MLSTVSFLSGAYSLADLAPLQYLDIGVIIAAVIMWKLESPKRLYADPAASLAISLIIFASAIPMSKSTLQKRSNYGTKRKFILKTLLLLFFHSLEVGSNLTGSSTSVS